MRSPEVQAETARPRTPSARTAYRPTFPASR